MGIENYNNIETFLSQYITKIELHVWNQPHSFNQQQEEQPIAILPLTYSSNTKHYFFDYDISKYTPLVNEYVHLKIIIEFKENINVIPFVMLFKLMQYWSTTKTPHWVPFSTLPRYQPDYNTKVKLQILTNTQLKYK
eukprot:UN02364